jgi:hypothetical protein
MGIEANEKMFPTHLPTIPHGALEVVGNYPPLITIMAKSFCS